jgi:2-phosphosulfolactate phosphatase
MQVDVISSVNEARSDDFINKTVIVVDALRATSTIVTALEHGSIGIVPVETVCQARGLQEANVLLGGERFCKKITGFDLGNSPFEYMTPEIEGKKIVMTTTNGTRAIQKSQKALHVIAGSMLNAAASAEAAIGLKRDIVIVCAGTQDQFSLEDGMCAGLLIDEIMARCENPVVTNDIGIAMHCLFSHRRNDLEEAIFQCSNGKRLSKLGFKEDVSFCCRVNLYKTVPVLSGDTLVPYKF